MTARKKPWGYGDEGAAHPVKPGQVWQIDAPNGTRHVFACADLMDGSDLPDRLTDRAQPTLIYTDPPWGQGLVNSFRTKAGLERADYTYLDLYRRILTLAPDLPAYVESGNREGPKIEALLRSLQPVVTAWSVTYFDTKPSLLHYAGPTPPPRGYTGLDDNDTPGEVIRAHGPTGTVLDPCAGRGLTSRAAHLNGWHSLNVELHPARVSAALHRLGSLSGTAPRRVE